MSSVNDEGKCDKINIKFWFLAKVWLTRVNGIISDQPPPHLFAHILSYYLIISTNISLKLLSQPTWRLKYFGNNLITSLKWRMKQNIIWKTREITQDGHPYYEVVFFSTEWMVQHEKRPTVSIERVSFSADVINRAWFEIIGIFFFFSYFNENGCYLATSLGFTNYSIWLAWWNNCNIWDILLDDYCI